MPLLSSPRLRRSQDFLEGSPEDIFDNANVAELALLPHSFMRAAGKVFQGMFAVGRRSLPAPGEAHTLQEVLAAMLREN